MKNLDKLEVCRKEKISEGWKWPDKPDICIYPAAAIKTLLSPALLQPTESLKNCYQTRSASLKTFLKCIYMHKVHVPFKVVYNYVGMLHYFYIMHITLFLCV